MRLELLSGLGLESQPEQASRVEGRTPSRQVANGNRWSWILYVREAPIIVWETQWSTGERDIVLANQELSGEKALLMTKLMSRRRALVEEAESFSYMSARRVDPDSDGWPRFSACDDADIHELIPGSSRQCLSEWGYLGVKNRREALSASGPNREQLIGMFAPGAEVAPIGFYALTRIVPTLRKAVML